MMNLFERSIKQYSWKTRPSKQEGYHKNYYIDSEKGDHLELDFNFPRQMVRISLKPADEFGREYISVIKSGTILQERDVTRRKPVDLTSRMSLHSKLFSYLHDESLLSVIGGNFYIPLKSIYHFRSSDKRDFSSPVYTGKKGFFKRLKDYLEKKQLIENRERTFVKSLLRRLPAEILDFSIGIGLITMYYMDSFSIIYLAALSGFTGLTMGAVDWVWRQRNPFLPKIFFMLCVSGVSVYIYVQYRMWGLSI